MQALGVLAGLAMLGGAFVRWDTVWMPGGLGTTRVTRVLGITTYSVDFLFGLHFLTPLAGLVYACVSPFARRNAASRWAGLTSAAVAFVVAAYAVVHMVRRPVFPDTSVEIGAGLWITLAASLVSLALSVVLMRLARAPG